MAGDGVERFQLDYSVAFSKVLNEAGGPVLGNRKPQRSAWMEYSVGSGPFSLSPVMIRREQTLRVALNLKGRSAKPFFCLLREQRQDIERELGYALEWQEKPGQKWSRVRIH